jgi:hypothetical protein
VPKLIRSENVPPQPRVNGLVKRKIITIVSKGIITADLTHPCSFASTLQFAAIAVLNCFYSDQLKICKA